MSETIKDGTGRGFLAKVNELNQVEVSSVGRTEESEVADGGYSFVASTEVLTLNSLNDHLLFYIKNTNTIKRLKLWTIHFGYNGGSTNHNRTMIVKFVTQPSQPTANYTSVVPDNFNLGSNYLAEADVYKWNGVGDGMTYTDGKISSAYIVNKGSTIFDMCGIPIQVLNSSTGIIIAAEEIGTVSITVRFFYK